MPTPVQRLVDAADAPVVVARLEGTLWLWNRRCEEVSSAPLDSVAGKPLWSMMRLRPAQQREARSAFERLVSGQDQSVSFQSVWVRKDGRKTRISWTARLVPAGTRPGFVVATGAEMTRGRRLMRELEETESRFATLFELLPDPVVVHQDGRLIYVNRAGVRMYGATYSDDIVGLPVADRLAPESRALVRDRFMRLMQGESVPMVEEWHLTMDGRAFDVEVVAAPVSIGGRPAVAGHARLGLDNRSQPHRAGQRDDSPGRRRTGGARLLQTCARDGRLSSLVAAGPNEALDHATALGPDLDLLVTDVVMPDLDGATLAAAITRNHAGLKVLFMSGYPRDLETELRGQAAGIGVLGKPFSARELSEAVRQVLDRPAGTDDTQGIRDASDLDDVHYVDQDEEDCQRGRHQPSDAENPSHVSHDVAVLFGCTSGKESLSSCLGGPIEFARPDAISRSPETGFRRLDRCGRLRLDFGTAGLFLVRKLLAGTENRTRLRSGRGVPGGMPLAGTVGATGSLGHWERSLQSHSVAVAHRRDAGVVEARCSGEHNIPPRAGGARRVKPEDRVGACV
jgi:PAS domain S-box-containing protein